MKILQYQNMQIVFYRKGRKKAKATSKQGIHHVLLNFVKDARPIATITAQKKS
jgi:hypothetical protein